MAIIATDSFALYGTPLDLLMTGTGWAEVNHPQNIAILPAGSESGLPAVQFTFDDTFTNVLDGSTNYSRYGEIVLDVPDYDTYIVGFRFRLDALHTSSNDWNCIFETNNNNVIDNQATLFINEEGYLAAGYATLQNYGESDDPLVVGAEYHIEIKHYGALTGSYEVRVNNKPVISVSNTRTYDNGLDTQLMRFGCNSVNSDVVDGLQYTISELYVMDDTGGSLDDFIGSAARVEYIPVNADGVVQFTPSSGADNSLMIDETGKHDYDTTRNVSSTVGHKDLLEIGALSEPTKGEILAIKPIMVANKDDASARTVDLIQWHNSVEGSSTKTLTQTYDYYSAFFTANPDTALQWEKSEWPSARIGYENMT